MSHFDKWKNNSDKEYMREYYQRPEVKKKIKEYWRKYQTASVFDIWTSEEILEGKGLREEEIKRRGLLGNIEMRMEPFVNLGLIEVLEDDNGTIYKPNLDSPYIVVMARLWELK
jgi:hypothetical protein